jgi:hypothetical protein
MIAQAIALLKDNKGVSVLITALTVVALLGGTGSILLPADRKVAQLEIHVAGVVEEASDYRQQQLIRGVAHDLQELNWQIEDIKRAIKQYSSSENIDDQLYVDSLKEELKHLHQRRLQLISILEKGGSVE